VYKDSVRAGCVPAIDQEEGLCALQYFASRGVGRDCHLGRRVIDKRLRLDERPAGASVTREFSFTQTSNFEFAYHLPEHYEAGMLSPITVQ
jgi:hypothetical protein